MRLKLLGVFAVLSVGLLLALPNVHADNICRGRQVAYVAPYKSVAYVAPAAYVAPVYKAEVYVPKVAQVLVSPDYYYSVSDGYRDAVLADAIAYRVLAAQGKFGQQQEPNPQGLPRFREQDKDARPQREQPREQSIKTDLPPGLQEIVNANCVKCHAGAANGIDMTDLSTIAEGLRWKSYALVNSGKMPKGKEALPDEKVKPFYDWAEKAKVVQR